MNINESKITGRIINSPIKQIIKLSLLLFFLLNLFEIKAQNIDVNFWRNPSGERINYQEVIESFEAFMEVYDETSASDELKREVKQFHRFIFFWGGRNQTHNAASTGFLDNYYKNVEGYLEVPACESVSNPEPWEAMGPFDYSLHVLGRVDCSWIDPLNPDVVFAGSSHSGLWKTINGTAGDDIVWYNVTDQLGLPGLGCASIAVHPINNDIMYVGVGNEGFLRAPYGPGIIKSLDGGETWTLLENFDFDNKTRAHKILIDPINPSVIYASARKEIYKSPDGGDSWVEITPENLDPSNNQEFWHMELDPGNSSVIYVGSRNKNIIGGGASFWKSTAGGDINSWSEIDLEELIVHPEVEQENLIDNIFSNWNPVNQVITVTPEEVVTEICGELVSPPQTFSSGVLPNLAEFLITFDVFIPEGCKLDIYTADNDCIEMQQIYWGEFFSSDESLNEQQSFEVQGFPGKILFVITANGNYDGVTELTISEPFIYSDLAEIEIDIPEPNHIYVNIVLWGNSKTWFFESEDGGNTWEYLTRSNGLSTSGINRTGFEVFNPSTDEFYSAGNNTGYFNGSGSSVASMYNYTSGNATVHADVRQLDYFSSQGTNILLVSNDGGLSKFENGVWSSMNGKYFPTNLFLDIGTSEIETDRYITGAFDNRTTIFNNGSWRRVGGGDGGASAIDPFNPNIFSYSSNASSSRVKYNPSTDSYPGLGIGFTQSRFFTQPIEPDPFDPGVVFYGTNNGLAKKSYLDYENSSAGDDVLVVSKTQLNAVGEVFDIEYFNDQIMYFVTEGVRWGSFNDDPTDNIPDIIGTNIFRSVDGGDNWLDISSTNSASNWYGPSSILSDPLDANRILVGYRGLPDESSKSRVMKSLDAGVTWTDWSKNLPALPVNDLDYQLDANYIYAGTDIGVYYRHRDDMDDNDPNAIGWVCFNEGLPPILITDVDVINCSQELVVSTYGRGVWKTKLIPAPDKLITTSQTWSDDLSVYSDIVVDNNAILTITGTLSMAEGKKITVMQGSKLIVNGGTITNSCGKFWRGIYAEGSSDGQGSPNNAAKLGIYNGAEISYARTALNNFIQTSEGDTDWSTTGGLIQSYNSCTFINNNRDAQFLTFQNENNNGDPIRDYSYFREANFIIDDNYLEDEGFVENITSYRCEGIRVEGCNFSDDRTGDILPYSRRTGILSSKSSVNVNQYCGTQICEAGIPNTFTNMNKGVHLNGTGSALFRNEIKNSSFITCWRGVYLWGNYNTEIWENEFEVTPYLASNGDVERSPVGIYLHKKTKDYHIEGNDFYPVENSTGIVNGHSIGIVANTQHGNNEEIYRNKFTHLTIGFESVGKNRFDAGLINNGLRIKCNDFNSDRADIYTTTGLLEFSQYGIALDQGFVGGDLAYNTFEYYPGLRNIDNDIVDGSGTVNYRYSIGVTEEFPSVVYDLGSNVFLFDENPPIGEKCPNEVEVIDIEIGLSERDDAILAKNQKELEMAQVIDGGNTEGLATEISLTDNTEAWEEYVALMSKSGYISETVMKEMIENESGFNSAMTRNVLVANEHSAKSKEISDALDARTELLPEYMREQIKLGLSEMSAKDFLQLRKDQYKFDQDKAVRQVYQALLTDSIPTDSMAKFIEILTGNNDIRYDYKLVDLYDAIGQNYLADALLEVMTNYELSVDQSDELNRYKNYRQLMVTWRNSGKDELNLNESDLLSLEVFAENNDMAGVEAVSLLILNSAITVEEPVYFPDENKSVDRSKPKNPIIDDSEEYGKLAIYPNPASNHFTLEYKIEKIYSKAEFRMVDAQGRVMYTNQLQNKQDQIIVDISQKDSFKGGVYQVEILLDGNSYLSESIVIE